MPNLPIQVDDKNALNVRDLSLSGACFFSEEPMPMMTHVKFNFQFKVEDIEHEVSGDGVVVRCERISPTLGHYEVAIFFQSLAMGGKESIEAYLVDKQTV